MSPLASTDLYAAHTAGDWRGRRGILPGVAAALAHDWSDTNLPWAYSSTADWEARIPAGATRVPLSSTGATFKARLDNTLNPLAANARVIIDLPEGVHTLNAFGMIGGSGKVNYAFGYWSPKLAGFCGQGPDKTFIEMAPNSMTQAQLDDLATWDPSTFAVSQIGFIRIDGDVSPSFLGGLTFRGGPQQPLTAVHPNLAASPFNVTTPQPAPYQGVHLYGGSTGVVSHVCFQGAGKALNSQPPFETTNLTSGNSTLTIQNCEFDGRLSDVFDPTRPRVCGPWMGNNEQLSDIIDCWMHHSNVSRYAANDQNINTAALSTDYRLTRVKIEHISDSNDNYGRGGYVGVSCYGWESTNARLTLTDCITAQDNASLTKGPALHMELTNVGGRAPTGGRLTATGCVWVNNAFPALGGFLTVRAIASTSWVTEGLSNTIVIKDSPTAPAKTAWTFTGTWPPTQAQIAAAGITPATHYIVRQS